MSVFSTARFFTTVNDFAELPQHDGIEIAFAGRSNAGKSSAINALVNQNRLAFVSKIPGRTRHINYFGLGSYRYLVDLPGYGYARVPQDMRRHWETLLGDYLQHRAALRGLVLIMDARRPLTRLDQQMLDWFSPTGKPVLVLLTKADKLTRSQGHASLKSVEHTLASAYMNAMAQLFSSFDRTGIEAAEQTISAWLRVNEPQVARAPPAVLKTKNPRLKGSKPGAKRLNKD